MSVRFPFVQFEFSHHIGPPEGRYVVRPPSPDGAEAEAEPALGELGKSDVLVVAVQGAAAAPRRVGRRRARSQTPSDEPREVSLTLVTVIKGTRMLAGRDEAQRLLESVGGSPDEQDRWVEDALAIVNRAVSAYRACAADPYAVDVSRGDAGAVRIGYGEAGSLTRGTWEAALVVPPARAQRVDRALRLMPTQGMAAVLAGRSRTLEAEDLLLRVVLDLEHGRARGAAAGLRAALELLGGELAGESLNGKVRERFDGAMRSRAAVSELAERATVEHLSPEEVQRLAGLTEEIGGFIDAWRYQSD